MEIYSEKTKKGKKKYISIYDYHYNDKEYINANFSRYICYSKNKKGLRNIIDYFQPGAFSSRIPGEITIIKNKDIKKKLGKYKIKCYSMGSGYEWSDYVDELFSSWNCKLEPDDEDEEKELEELFKNL